MKNEMASELHVLARDAARVARQNPRTADFTRHILQRAIRELIACFPVYRTYVNNDARAADAETGYLRSALTLARRHERDLDPSVFDFLEALLTGALVATPRSGFSRHSVLRCAMKLQQYSGPVMAKGFEDTALYRFNRLIALNEVGGYPEHYGVSIAEFHDANVERAKRWPYNLLSTATHDTKRGEDARARLLVLSEMPDEWFDAVRDWNVALRDVSATLNDANAEYFFYQTLLAGWPANGACDESFRERVRHAMRKSVREAKVRTSWSAPDVEYEGALTAFIDTAFRREEFLDSFVRFQGRIAALGVHNSLAQTTLKLTAPGVPDIYQGSELWDLSFVDPDNRRGVDYEVRERLLADAMRDWRASAAEAIRIRRENWQDGAIKLLLTSLLLRCRAEHPVLFAEGDYQPCEVSGPDSERLCAFVRTHAEKCLLVVVALLPTAHAGRGSLQGVRVRVPTPFAQSAWQHVFLGPLSHTGEFFDADQLLSDLPVAVVVNRI
jgi:(1->4)-alpha-D-glucan 1-alpha-D-glucosylmutase